MLGFSCIKFYALNCLSLGRYLVCGLLLNRISLDFRACLPCSHIKEILKVSDLYTLYQKTSDKNLRIELKRILGKFISGHGVLSGKLSLRVLNWLML